jgi:hypothetical protein
MYSLQNPQTLQEFLAKYAGALDSQGRFIEGKANLEYDGMKAEDVYKLMIGGSPLMDADGNSMGTQPMAAEVNADWIEDPRAKGWIGQHPTGAAIIGTVLGGVGAQAMGLLGAGSAGGASTAFGGGGLGAANAVTAADLALTAMPQAVTGAGTFAGGGTMAGLGGAAAAGGAAGSALGSSAFGSSTPSWMTSANAVGAGDLATVSMPQAVTGAGTFAGGGTVGGGLLSSAGQFLKDNPTLTKLGGAALGALAGGDTTTSSQKDPWGPAQPYLKENLQRNSAMQDYYAKNPFSTEQKTAYQGLLDTLANNQANAPAMAGMANSFMGSNRGLLSNMPTFSQGTKAAPIDWAKYQNIGLMG